MDLSVSPSGGRGDKGLCCFLERGEGRELAQLGRDIRVAKMSMSCVDRTVEMGHTRGFIKEIVDASQTMGATVLDMEGGEIMAMAS